MKLASFNVENLFDRAVAMNQPTLEAGKAALEAAAQLNAIFAKTQYTAADKEKILQELNSLGLLKSDDGGKFARLRQNHGKLLKRPKTGAPQVVANGRGSWIGWVELKTDRVDEAATENAARVIQEVGADILGVVEVDSRIALRRFNDGTLKTVDAAPYRHVMVIDGNDDRGIDVGLLTNFPIGNMRSHVDDVIDGQLVFSRDCPEYEIQLPSGKTLLLLINHFKSKGYGGQQDSNERRRRQAQRVREIYDSRRAAGMELVAVIGDFNDTPDSVALAPLLQNASDLRDVSQSPNFQLDNWQGTYGETQKDKIDYILLSSALFVRVNKAGAFRKGVWSGKTNNKWQRYDMAGPEQAASDHAAIWAELNISL
jgi:endonuclease/exonuclease/phosphatase family metal-dependent hydrolase